VQIPKQPSASNANPAMGNPVATATTTASSHLANTPTAPAVKSGAGAGSRKTL
jgi:hypothetical protein